MFTLIVGSITKQFTDRMAALATALQHLDYAREAGVPINLWSPTGANLLRFTPKEA